MLGAEIGNQAAMVAQFQEKTGAIKQMLSKLPLCQDAQVELVLQRSCFGLAMVNNLLRANGTELMQHRECLQEFDAAQVEGL